MELKNRLHENWEIDHLVMVESEGRIMVAAKEDDGCDLLFCVDQHTGSVYVRQPDGCWEQIFGTESRGVIAQYVAARNRGIPVYSQ